MIPKAYIVWKSEIIETEIPASDFILENPERFGLTREGTESVYEKHCEAYGTEGDAIEEILRSVVLLGLIIVERTEGTKGWETSSRSGALSAPKARTTT